MVNWQIHWGKKRGTSTHFWVYGSKVWQFNWKLSSSRFLCYRSFVTILQHLLCDVFPMMNLELMVLMRTSNQFSFSNSIGRWNTMTYIFTPCSPGICTRFLQKDLTWTNKKSQPKKSKNKTDQQKKAQRPNDLSLGAMAKLKLNWKLLQTKHDQSKTTLSGHL